MDPNWHQINGAWDYQPPDFDQDFEQQFDHAQNLHDPTWNADFAHQDFPPRDHNAHEFNQQPWPPPKFDPASQHPGIPMPAFNNFNHAGFGGFDQWHHQIPPHAYHHRGAQHHQSPFRLLYLQQRLSTLQPSLRRLRERFSAARHIVITMLRALSPLATELLDTQSGFFRCVHQYKPRKADRLFTALLRLREKVGRRAREVQRAWKEMEGVRERLFGVGVLVRRYEEEMEGLMLG